MLILGGLNFLNDAGSIWDALTPAFIGLAGVLLGGFVTWFVEICLRNRELKLRSIQSAYYIEFLLIQQRTELEKVSFFMKRKPDSKDGSNALFKKLSFSTMDVSINSNLVESFISYRKIIIKRENYITFLQLLTTTQNLKNHCFTLMEEHNQIIDRMLIEQSSKEKNDTSLAGYGDDVISNHNNTKIKYDLAVSSNKKARVELARICNIVFKKYKTLATGDIMELKEFMNGLD